MAFSVSPFGCLVHKLIKGWIDIIRKLNFCNRSHSLRRTPNRKSYNTLFTKRGIEDSFTPKFSSKVHTAAKNPAKCDIFAEDENPLVRTKGMRKGTIYCLEKVEARCGGMLRIRWARVEKGGSRLVEERVRGVIERDIETGAWGVAGVTAMSDGLKAARW
jgi:hypothetical protein